MTEEELEQLLDDKDSKSTKNVLKQALETFNCYCRAKSLDFEKVEKEYSEQELVYAIVFEHSTQRCGEEMANFTPRDP